jgi:hypothetical protein
MAKLKILILANAQQNSVQTVLDHIFSFQRYSRHQIQYLDPVGLDLPPGLDLNAFDVLVIHYSIFVLEDHYFNPIWRTAVSDARCLKVQFIQDEYRRVFAMRQRIRELGIDLLFSCYPTPVLEDVYPSLELPGLTVVNTLTGFVPPEVEGHPPRANQTRPVDIGYRARGLGLYWLGELYQEKSRIGRRVEQAALRHGLKCDISSREADRLHGQAWHEFLDSCRCTLGSESGASLTDFSGSLELMVDRYCKQNPYVSFLDAKNRFFAGQDGKVPMGQVSPRIFESIGHGVGLVLLEGGYSGAVEPGLHYLELKKDFSNLDQVLEQIQDRQSIEAMAKRAYQDVVAPGRYSHRRFVQDFDTALDETLYPDSFSLSPSQIPGTLPGEAEAFSNPSSAEELSSVSAYTPARKLKLLTIALLSRMLRLMLLTLSTFQRGIGLLASVVNRSIGIVQNLASIAAGLSIQASKHSTLLDLHNQTLQACREIDPPPSQSVTEPMQSIVPAPLPIPPFYLPASGFFRQGQTITILSSFPEGAGSLPGPDPDQDEACKALGLLRICRRKIALSHGSCQVLYFLLDAQAGKAPLPFKMPLLLQPADEIDNNRETMDSRTVGIWSAWQEQWAQAVLAIPSTQMSAPGVSMFTTTSNSHAHSNMLEYEIRGHLRPGMPGMFLLLLSGQGYPPLVTTDLAGGNESGLVFTWPGHRLKAEVSEAAPHPGAVETEPSLADIPMLKVTRQN